MAKDGTVVFVLFIILAFALLIFPGKLSLFSLIMPSVSFAGTPWNGIESVQSDAPEQATFSTQITQNGFWQTDYTSLCTWEHPNNDWQQTYTSAKSYESIDDILIIYSYVLDNPSNTFDKSCESSFEIGFKNEDGSDAGVFVSDSCRQGHDNNNGANNRCHKVGEISMIKVQNNFDGTWAVLRYAGIGDVFTRQGTVTTSGPLARPHLYLKTRQTTSLFGGGPNTCQSNGQVVIYNVVEKTNEVVNCNAGEALLENGSCTPIEGLLLENERAIREQLLAELARIEARLTAKQDALTARLDLILSQIQSQINSQNAAFVSQLNALTEQLHALQSSGASQAQIDAVQNQINTLTQQYASANSQNSELVNQLNTLTSQLNALRDSGASQAQIDAVQNDIDELRTRYASTNPELANLINLYASLKESLGDVQNGLAYVKERNNTIIIDNNPYGQNPTYDPTYRGDAAVIASGAASSKTPWLLIAGVGVIAVILLVLLNRRK